MIDRVGRKDLARFHFPGGTSFPGTIYVDEHEYGNADTFIRWLCIRELSSILASSLYSIQFRPGQNNMMKITVAPHFSKH
jgi:hypothetical protein